MLKSLSSRVFFFFLLCLFAADPLQAAVVINEVLPNPTTGNEWVELYNPDEVPVDVTNWTLWDELSSPSLLTTVAQTMPPHTFLVVEISSKLNNSGDGVTLRNPSGDATDQFLYATSQPDLSWARTSDNSFALSSPTPGAPNVPTEPSPSPTPTSLPITSPTPSPSPHPNTTPYPTPSSYPSPTPFDPHTISLSEIMACPVSGETEWVELYNANSFAITLTNWQLQDASGQLKNVTIQLAAQSYGVISWSGAYLNNTGETLTLLAPDSTIIDSYHYDQCNSNTSFIRYQAQWFVTTDPSRGTNNVLSQTSENESSETALYSSIPSPKAVPSPQPSHSPITSPSSRAQLKKTLSSVSKPPLTGLTPPHFSLTVMTDLLAPPAKFTTFRDYTPPEALLKSVILGGFGLLLTGSWFVLSAHAKRRLPTSPLTSR